MDLYQSLMLTYPLTIFLMSCLLFLTYFLVGKAKYLIYLSIAFAAMSIGIALQLLHFPHEESLNGTLSGLFFLIFSYSISQGIVLLEGKQLNTIACGTVFTIAFTIRCASSLLPNTEFYYFISVFSVYSALVIFLGAALWKVRHLILGDLLEKIWCSVLAIWFFSLIGRLAYVYNSSDILRILVLKHGYTFYGYASDLQQLFYLFALLFIVLTLLLAIKRLIFDISRKSFLDNLTGAYNRRGLQNFIEFELPKLEHFGLVMLDIDFFKVVNTKYGHPVGDAVIQTVVVLIRDHLSDIDHKTIRLGGEEFMIVLPKNDLQALFDVAEGLRLSIQQYDFSDVAHDLKITVSMGVGEYEASSNFQEIYKEIDQKLAAAKKNGRNQVVKSI